MTLELPEYADDILTSDATYVSVDGGRASAKTWTVAHKLVLDAIQGQEKIMVCRSYKASLPVSAIAAIKIAITNCGVDRMFDIQRDHIYGTNGSEFEFSGLETDPDRQIRGWEGITKTWVEEASGLSDLAARILVPTALRRANSQILFTWNANERTDWVWQRFIENPRPSDLVMRVNYDQNPFLPPLLEEEIREMRELDPVMFRHVWKGEPLDAAGDKHVLPYHLLRACKTAYQRGLWKEADLWPIDIGLDIADGGADKNALAVRMGPVLTYLNVWASTTPGDLLPTATTAHIKAIETGAEKLWYDAGGVGSAIRGDFLRLDGAYELGAINNNQVVGGPDFPYRVGRTNEQEFTSRGIQNAWNLRLRALRTIQLLKGRDVDINKCLFLSTDIPQLETMMVNMTKPTWYNHPQSGKVTLDKKDLGARGVQGANYEKNKSPDEFDAVALAFGGDAEHGLLSTL